MKSSAFDRALLRFLKTRDRTLKLKSNEPRNTQNGCIEIHQSQITNHDLLFPKRSSKMWRQESADSSEFDWRRRKTQNPKTFFTPQVPCYPKKM